MSEWWRRRRRIFDLIDEMMRELFEEMERDWSYERDLVDEIRRIMREFDEIARLSPEEASKYGEKKIIGPYVYGFSITIGPDGKPIIKKFGNIKSIRGKPMITEEREPLVDVFESDDEVTVVAELPGVEKDKISLEVTDDRRKLIIRASNSKRKYYKEVDLPAEVDPESAKANYKNGVLEVKLKKIKKEKRGYEIRVD